MTRGDEVELIGRWSAALARARRLAGPAFGELVDALLAELELLPSGPTRSRRAGELIQLVLGRRDQDGMVVPSCLDRLVQLGDEHPPDQLDWRRVRAVARCLALMRGCAAGESVDHRAALAEVDRLAAEFADEPQLRALAAATQATLALASGQVDPSTLRALPAELGRLADGNAELAPLLELMSDYLDAFQAQQSDDSSDAFGKLLQVMSRSQEAPVPNTVRAAMAEVMPVVELIQPLLAGGSAAPDFDRKLQGLVDRPGVSPERRATYLTARAGAISQEQELDRIDATIADLRAALTLTSDDHPHHVFQLASLALAWWRRSEVSGSLGDVDEAIVLLEQARELAGGPGHQQWSYVNAMLSELLRRRGDISPSRRRIALEGLRGYVWQVLLQPDPASARVVAQRAAEEATEVATRFLIDQEPADALRALDAGRGLMLFAATELRDPYTRLIDAGEPELADRWRADQRPSAVLRRDVLEVLSRDTGLLDAPDLGEIQAALRALDADALVYLVPANPPVTGWAVIAPVDGPARCVPLPNLRFEAGTDIERYLAALAGLRDIRVEEAAQTELMGSVDALCEWAWKAAMGPVVKPYLAADRIPHLVLIPMGDLARVPWQAARDPDGRYLVERVALSQAASARMLCNAAAAEPVRLTTAGLVVADPDTGRPADALRSARLEAYAIRESFYPSATYLGRLPNGTVSGSGAGKPDEVRDWLQADGAAAGAMLHLASHGIIESALGSASSRLVLAGGDLVADELIGVLAGSTRHQIGLVVLAACHTGESIHGYDEAYSLATMFLAAGVRSVLSTQWSVPDRATSLLMYMFHHYLVTERRPPWDALRRAQVWMLDHVRTAPSRMPGPLRRTLAGSDPARVVAWAGFVHWGQ